MYSHFKRFRLEGTRLKSYADNPDIIYIHVNEVNRYVLSHGIEFKEFVRAVPDLNNLLLLAHKYDDGTFNHHTLFEYVESDLIQRLRSEEIQEYGDFCWIDFEEEEALNVLEAQEIAELLYLSHIKNHLRLPFYRKLNNRFAYLSHEDSWFNKTYYRSFDDFYDILGEIIAGKMSDNKGEKSFFGRKKKRDIPSVPKEILYPFIEDMKEGMVISIGKSVQTRPQLEIPIWVIGDYYNMNEMYEEYSENQNLPVDGKLVYDRKAKEWKAFVK
jgi:hypothetical protein